MKKTMFTLMLIALLTALTACGGKAAAEVETVAPLTLLETVWQSYEEEELFPVMGGDYVQMVMDAPGEVDITDSSSMDSLLAFPADQLEQLEGAASLIHAMNANTFTCGSYQLKDPAQAEALAQTLRDQLQSRQWICGFPDKLVIAKSGGCLVSMFGAADVVDPFRDHLTQCWQDTEILFDESIAG